MPAGNYKRPPIAESVLEIQYAESIASTAIDRIAARVKSTYPEQQARLGVFLNLDAGKAEAASVPEGMRLASRDQADVLLLSANKVSTARLAPYTTWAQFFARAKSDQEEVKKVAGYRKAVRLGLRYVNRLDIPGTKIRLSEYLNIGLRVPKEIVGDLHGYSLSSIYSLVEEPYKVNFNSGVVESVLVDHVSLLLDLDVFRDKEVSAKEGEIWDNFERMRVLKNKVFEACITDQARQLFDR